MILFWIMLALSARLELLTEGWYTGVWASVPVGMVGVYYNWVDSRLEAAVWSGSDLVPVWFGIIFG